MEVGASVSFVCIQKLTSRWCSNPTPVTSPESENKLSKPGFHFPYSYEDEDEDLDDSSREASVEILGCGTTNSRKEPASKCAEVEILICPEAPRGPERPREVFDLTMASNIKALSRKPDCGYLGSSQDHPIDLEPERPAMQAELIDDSDCEPPEVLPISQASLKAMSNTRPYDPFRYYEPVGAPPVTAGVAAVPKPQEDNATQPMVADSDADETDDEISCIPSDDEDGPCSDIGSLDASEKSWSDDEDRDLAKTSDHFTAGPAESIVETIAQDTHILIEDSQFRDRLHTRSNIADILDVNAATLDEPNKDKAVSETQCNKPAPRAPSPSDAALARPPQATPQPINEAKSDQMCSTFNKAPIASPWCRHKNHGDKDGEASSMQWARHNNNGHRDAESTPLQWIPPWEDTTTRTQAFMDANLNCVMTEMDDHSLPRYDDGPFSGWGYPTIPENPYNSSHYPHGIQSQQSISCRISSDTNSGLNNLAIPRGAALQLTQASSASMEMEEASVLEQMAEYGRDYGEIRVPCDPSYSKPAKLPISDIVNQSSDSGRDRPLKRKADDMAADGMEDVARPEQSLLIAAAVHDSEDYPLPDAQPREDLTMPDNTLQETVHQAELIRKVSATPSLHAAMPYNTLQETAQEAESIAKAPTASSSDEPPRKKAKTSRGSSRPVKAFVSGVVVGCLSLVGACAAFLATIPENIREEALREM